MIDREGSELSTILSKANLKALVDDGRGSWWKLQRGCGRYGEFAPNGRNEAPGGRRKRNAIACFKVRIDWFLAAHVLDYSCVNFSDCQDFFNVICMDWDDRQILNRLSHVGLS